MNYSGGARCCKGVISQFENPQQRQVVKVVGYVLGSVARYIVVIQTQYAESRERRKNSRNAQRPIVAKAYAVQRE